MSIKQYQQITDRIIAQLEAGTPPWRQSWTAGGGRPLRHDGTRYRGANVINLWSAAMARGFNSAHWLTYRKAQELGGQVRKGARSESAFYVGAVTRTEDRNGEEVERTIPFLRAYCVFNVDEIDGLPAQYHVRSVVTPLDPAARVPAVDLFIAQTGAAVVYGGGRTFYRRSTDQIYLPEFGCFDSASAFYGTALHELTHWSGADKRLARTFGATFGNPEYAFEELVAELGAAYLCADLAISAEPREDHASYIAGWLKALRHDSRAIFRAAAHAERAAGYLHGASAVPDAIAA